MVQGSASSMVRLGRHSDYKNSTHKHHTVDDMSPNTRKCGDLARLAIEIRLLTGYLGHWKAFLFLRPFAVLAKSKFHPFPASLTMSLVYLISRRPWSQGHILSWTRHTPIASPSQQSDLLHAASLCLHTVVSKLPRRRFWFSGSAMNR